MIGEHFEIFLARLRRQQVDACTLTGTARAYAGEDTTWPLAGSLNCWRMMPSAPNAFIATIAIRCDVRATAAEVILGDIQDATRRHSLGMTSIWPGEPRHDVEEGEASIDPRGPPGSESRRAGSSPNIILIVICGHGVHHRLSRRIRRDARPLTQAWPSSYPRGGIGVDHWRPIPFPEAASRARGERLAARLPAGGDWKRAELDARILRRRRALEPRPHRPDARAARGLTPAEVAQARPICAAAPRTASRSPAFSARKEFRGLSFQLCRMRRWCRGPTPKRSSSWRWRFSAAQRRLWAARADRRYRRRLGRDPARAAA